MVYSNNEKRIVVKNTRAVNVIPIQKTTLNHVSDNDSISISGNHN